MNKPWDTWIKDATTQYGSQGFKPQFEEVNPQRWKDEMTEKIRIDRENAYRANRRPQYTREQAAPFGFV